MGGVNMYKGYDFYFLIDADLLTLPITPSEIKIKSGSNNKVITLINEGEINVLKPTALMEIEFEARFPMRNYPYAREYPGFTDYFNKFTLAKQNRKPVRFMIVRTTPSGVPTWGTGVSENNLFSIETLETKESADEGDDVIVSFKLKQYKEYMNYGGGTGGDSSISTSTSNTARTNSRSSAKEYTVKTGDCLWNIAKAEYGDGSKYTVIYNANKKVIEDTANKYRNGKGSSNGHYIYPGTKLIIPSLRGG